MTEYPTEVRDRARDLLFDYLTVARRGSRSGPAIAAQNLIDGPGGALVEGTTVRTAGTTAAMVNGIAGHAIELDDTYEPASIHPGVAIWPAVLAVADEQGATLGDVLDAGVAAYDAITELGDRLDPCAVYARGFHPTGVCGPIGAAIGVAHLLRLTPAQRDHAVAIATSSAAGLLAFLDDGAWTKPLHAGHAAQSGIIATRLAAAGYIGPAGAISGSNGLINVFGPRAAGSADGNAAPGRGILRTAVKRYPACRYTHANIDAILDLVADTGMVPEEITSVSCAVLDAGAKLIADPIAQKRQVRSLVDAQFSMPFLAAVALHGISPSLDTMVEAPQAAARMEWLMHRISCHRNANLEAAFPDCWGGEVVITTSYGNTLTRAVAEAAGSPGRPLDRAGLVAKAQMLIGAEEANSLAKACFEGRVNAVLARTTAERSRG